MLQYPTDGQARNGGYCQVPQTPPPFLEWLYESAVRVQDSKFVNNTAACATCCGGGLSVGLGGALVLSNTTVTGNFAGLFGGGALFGGVASGSGTCSVNITQGTLVQANIAKRSASQLAINCAGALAVDTSTIDLGVSEAEVRGL